MEGGKGEEGGWETTTNHQSVMEGGVDLLPTPPSLVTDTSGLSSRNGTLQMLGTGRVSLILWLMTVHV